MAVISAWQMGCSKERVEAEGSISRWLGQARICREPGKEEYKFIGDSVIVFIIILLIKTISSS
jgi:hypothetical protein